MVTFSFDPVALLRAALEIESLSGQEDELARFLVGQMEALGYTRAYLDPAGNAVGEMGDVNAPHTIVLLGHMDTVLGWIPVRVEEGVLYGRGAVDAKGPLCAFISAVARVGERTGTRFVVVGATEEEAATSKGARFIRDRFMAERVPDACIIGEPSGWDRITLGYKGRQLVDAIFRQPLSHTAGPDARVAEWGVVWWLGVKHWAEAHNAAVQSAFDALLPSLRRFQTGGDGLMEWAELEVGLRLPLGLTPDEIARRVQEARADVPNSVAVQFQFRGYEPAYRADRNNKLVRAFQAAIRSAGGRPGFKLKTGTSDMNVVGPVWNCPIVAYGPGDSRLDHTPNEHIRLDEYLRGIEVLTEAVRALTNFS